MTANKVLENSSVEAEADIAERDRLVSAEILLLRMLFSALLFAELEMTSEALKSFALFRRISSFSNSTSSALLFSLKSHNSSQVTL